MPITYESIATQTLSSPAAVINFNSIAASWTDLKVILIPTGNSGGTFTPLLRFNGSSGGTEYSDNNLYGDGGATIAAVNNTSSNYISLGTGGSMSSIPTLIEFDVFSYTGSHFKTILGKYSSDRNGSGFTGIICGIRRNTAAITAINLATSSAANFDTGTIATLYGIKNA